MADHLLDLQIPPAKSPLLLPTDAHRQSQRTNSADSFRLSSIQQDKDVLDDMEFMAPGNWEEHDAEDESDDDSIEDFTLEEGHIAGVPAANMRLEAKQYHTAEFLTALLELLRDDLRTPGWSSLPSDIPSSLIHIHKVSGSLTNAVFFVSIPSTTLNVDSSAAAALPPPRATPASFAAEIEAGRATPTPGGTARRVSDQKESSITIEAPTLLLRIYGPSSGSLISRRTELHILHTLSSDYLIGPKVLGTFSNGRVEEYFHSRALHKEEMRDARISRWIGRRMRELHRVELEKMEVPGGSRRGSIARGGEMDRPPLDVGGRGPGSSSGSIYSTSSGSSIFSFGASTYSNSSYGSTSSLATLGSEHGTPLTSSPLLLPRGGSSESRADSKKRSRSLMSSRGRRAKDKLGVWENITRWTREAKLVLKELDQLASLPGFSDLLAPPPPSLSTTLLAEPDHVAPLSSPALTIALREALNLPLFEQQVKLYRAFVHEWENKEGKSKRVFSHNDTQYGNLLLLTPKEGDERALERSIQVPHHRIIVVDFEYASANPRGFDIANHFIEWQADYHHPTLSHSLIAHAPYPTPSERTRFLRAYIGCDSGFDANKEEPEPNEEDPRVELLENEVRVWEPSSHAMWAVWGIVQAKEDLLAKVAKWKKECEVREERKRVEVEKGLEGLEIGEGGTMRMGGGKERSRVGKGEKGEEEEEQAADFDYLAYALGRITLFREELKALGVTE